MQIKNSSKIIANKYLSLTVITTLSAIYAGEVTAAEMTSKSHSRTLVMTFFNRLYMTSYYCSIITMFMLYCFCDLFIYKRDW